MIKLPENSNDRKKILAVLCLAALVIGYAVVAFGLQPYMVVMKVRKERINELEESIQHAKKDVNAIEQNMAKNNELVSELLGDPETKHYILRPNLGNYLLVASTILQDAAAGLRMSIDSITEIPMPPAAPPPTTDKKKSAKNTAQEPARLAPYTANVSLTGGLHALTSFINRLESGNPYITVTRLVVMEQSQKDVENHIVNLHLQWPVWVDNDHPRRLEAEQIADEERR